MIRCCVSQHFRQFARHFASEAAAAIENKIRLVDVNISYVQSGSGSKHVLLMPGAIGSAWIDFKPQIEKLPNVLPDYNIIAWDPPGYGKSRPPKRSFTTRFYQEDADYAKKFMTAIGIEKFSILGWSDGGVSGMIIAAKHPETIEKLVMWGSNPYISDEEAAQYKSIRDVSKWSQRMREPMENIYGVEGFAEIWADWVDTCLEIHKKPKGDICIDDVGKIKAPTLILHGKKDPMLAPEHIPYLLKHLKHVEYFEFPDGKHNIHLRYPDEFNKVVADFLLKDFVKSA